MKERLKKLVSYAKLHNIAIGQRDLGNKLGYTSEQYISRLFSGHNADYSDFCQKVKLLIPEINKDWLLTGSGEMLLNSAPAPAQTAIDGINATNATVQFHDLNSTAALQKLTEEIAEQRKMYVSMLEKKDAELARRDEQINRLLEIVAKK